MHTRRPKVNTSYLQSLASFHLTFWDRVSLWTRRPPIWLDWLARNPQTSSCLCLASTRIIGVHGHPYFLFVFLFNTWVLGICIEVFMLSWQVFYPQSFQRSSQLALKVQPNHEEEFLKHAKIINHTPVSCRSDHFVFWQNFKESITTSTHPWNLCYIWDSVLILSIWDELGSSRERAL